MQRVDCFAAVVRINNDDQLPANIVGVSAADTMANAIKLAIDLVNEFAKEYNIKLEGRYRKNLYAHASMHGRRIKNDDVVWFDILTYQTNQLA